MKILNIKKKDIEKNKKIQSKFLSSFNNRLKINCNILSGNFYLDTFNYFPITEELYSFYELYRWGENQKYQNFYSKKFYTRFNENIANFKSISDVFVLGSSAADNYYRNILTFLPRLFFVNSKNIKIALHRSSSNKLRSFIKMVCLRMGFKIQFVFLDDGFYKFNNSQIPHFFPKKQSIKILNSLKDISPNNLKEKIYLVRQNCDTRNLINEVDIIEKLKKNNFKIVNLNELDIFDQIKLFSHAKVVVSATGSSLVNIVFCNPGTKVIEISPKYQFKFEDYLNFRFKKICNYLDLEYHKIEADPVNIENIEGKIKKIIPSEILNSSNYYKNLVLKLASVKDIIEY